MTTNLPFSEWTQVIPNARLCKRCWTGSPIALTSSKSAPTATIPANGRERQVQTHGCSTPSAFRYAPARSPANLYPTTLFNQVPQVVQDYKISCPTHVGDRAIPVLSIGVFIRLGPAFSR
jgi:hypothetical protein